MKVLIADKLAEEAIERIKKLGCEVTVDPELKAEDLKEHLQDINILVVRSTKVTKEVFNAAPDLSLVVRAGAGVNTIDLETASTKGIFVANCPGKNADAVAELTIGLLIAADRRIVDASSDLRQGKWKKKEYQNSMGLKGKTLGLIGYGTVGKKVVQRARGLEMKILVWSRSMTPERAEEEDICYASTPLEVAKNSDAVTVHVAATKDTLKMINGEFFQAMKPGTIFINTSRGDIVDTEALKTAVKERNIKAALDVYDPEPGSGIADFEDSDLARMITCTPHIGASTNQASTAIAEEAFRIIKAFKGTGFPLNAVNVSTKSTAIYSLIVRHLNRVGVLAGVLDILREDGVNVEEMQNTIFSHGESACCTFQLDQGPSAEALAKIRKSDHIIVARLEKI